MGVRRVADVLLTCADVCWQVEGGSSSQLSYKEVACALAESERAPMGVRRGLRASDKSPSKALLGLDTIGAYEASAQIIFTLAQG
jgi:hypothetical protein